MLPSGSDGRDSDLFLHFLKIKPGGFQQVYRDDNLSRVMKHARTHARVGAGLLQGSKVQRSKQGLCQSDGIIVVLTTTELFPIDVQS